jgi:hypothetical protein
MIIEIKLQIPANTNSRPTILAKATIKEDDPYPLPEDKTTQYVLAI